MGRQGLITRRRAAAAVSEVAHAVEVGGTRVALTLRRSARRSFALQVDHRGARVAAPLRATLADIDRFVREHGQWLLDRLAARAAAIRPAFQIEDGALLPVLGVPVRLRLAGAARAAVWRHGPDGAEELQLPLAGDPGRVLLRALKARALDWHRNRVDEFCLRLELPVPAVSLSSARTRWGSCSSASGIRLHWRLIHLPPALIDYVVAHEVAHLLEMNHSPRFWAVVERIYPDWRQARRMLRAEGARLPLIDHGAAAGMEE